MAEPETKIRRSMDIRKLLRFVFRSVEVGLINGQKKHYLESFRQVVGTPWKRKFSPFHKFRAWARKTLATLQLTMLTTVYTKCPENVFFVRSIALQVLDLCAIHRLSTTKARKQQDRLTSVAHHEWLPKAGYV